MTNPDAGRTDTPETEAALSLCALTVNKWEGSDPRELVRAILTIMSVKSSRLERERDQARKALKELLLAVNNIEVLGEWSALDINPTQSKIVRAKVDAIVAKGRAALSGRKEG